MATRPQSAEGGYSSSGENNLPQVQGASQRDLEDDGIRTWQEQAIALLDNNYQDWKDPESTYMVPAAFPSHNKPDKGHLCEKRVYDLLQEFGEKYKEPMFVVHSHNFKKRIDSIKSGDLKVKKWLIGEHDFLIIHKLYGPIFFQVKARGENKWLKAFQEAQDQVNNDKISLKIFLENWFDGVKGKHKQKLPMFDYPGFVVMPNCRRPKPTSVQHDNGVFQEDCINMESFRSWWDQNVVKDGNYDPEIYKELLVRFVALVHSGPPLNLQIQQSSRQIVFYTKQQLEILVQSPPQQWITGPAGSGKTLLLIKKVLDLAEDIKDNRNRKGTEERILVLAFNEPLCGHLDQTLKKPFEDVKIDVLTYSQFLSQKKIVSADHFSDDMDHKDRCNEVDAYYAKFNTEQPPLEQQYEHIFVDEGQDLYGEHWPELLKLYHNQPVDVPDGVFYFWVMYDSNQHVQPAENKLPIRYFQNAHRLTRVLRNTENVFKLSKKYFTSVHQRNSEIALAHPEVGLNIKWVSELMPGKSNGPCLLMDTIEQLQQQKVEASDIVVLTRNEEQRENLRCILESQGQIPCQSAEDRNDRVIVESIRRFKGLESKVVILYDPIFSVFVENQSRQLLYVAVSRCRCYLILISTNDGCKYLKSEGGILDIELRARGLKDRLLEWNINSSQSDRLHLLDLFTLVTPDLNDLDIPELNS